MKLAAAQIIKSGSFERVVTTVGGDGGATPRRLIIPVGGERRSAKTDRGLTPPTRLR